MIILCLPLLLTLAAGANAGGPLPADPWSLSNAAPSPEMMQPHTGVHKDQESISDSEPQNWLGSLPLQRKAAHEISIGRYTVDGIAVELLKADNPLELIDPTVPERYGWMNDNLVPTLRPTDAAGLKIFELRF